MASKGGKVKVEIKHPSLTDEKGLLLAVGEKVEVLETTAVKWVKRGVAIEVATPVRKKRTKE